VNYREFSLEECRSAYLQVLPYILKTPLVRCIPIEKKLKTSHKVYLKLENRQVTKSFKIRGAFYALLSLSEEEKKKGVVTRSAGNFAIAVAFAAKTLGIQATLVMAENVSPIKKQLAAQYGPRIILFGTTHKEGNAKVQELVEKEQLVRLSPFDHRDVIVGQGTLALEIFEELPTVRHFFAPIGGGGLLGGTSACFKKLSSDVEIHGIEPEGANDYFLSRKTGRKVVLDKPITIADGLRANEVGSLNRPLLDRYVDHVATVTDKEILRAMRFMKDELDIMIEPSAACAVAYVFHRAPSFKGDAVCILTGGNIDLQDFEKLVRSIEKVVP